MRTLMGQRSSGEVSRCCRTSTRRIGLQKALTYRIARLSARLNRDGSHTLAQAGGPSLTGWRIMATVALLGKGTLASLREKDLARQGDAVAGPRAARGTGPCVTRTERGRPTRADLCAHREGGRPSTGASCRSCWRAGTGSGPSSITRRARDPVALADTPGSGPCGRDGGMSRGLVRHLVG